jgi:hypothetical protein
MGHDASAGKRTVTVSLKMTAEDAELLERATAKLWNDAPVTRSTAVLHLAKIGAQSVLRDRKPAKRKP